MVERLLRALGLIVILAAAWLLGALAWRGLWVPDPDEMEESASWMIERARA